MVTIKDDVMRLELGKDSYDIVVGVNLFERAARELAELKYGFKHAIITDSNVKPYAEKLASALRNEGIKAHIFDFPAGEENKQLATYETIGDQMDAEGFGRDSVVCCVGGGVVTDLGGFLAATYARGVPCVLFPTSTAAQADAAIGGKTGVNSKKAKNRYGQIQQPKRIYVDVATLETLPERSYREGIAEWVKHGVIRSADFFGFLEQNVDKILAKDRETLIYCAKENAIIKGTVVELDPEETALRQILNHGHTVGHVLEQRKYGNLMHGEAVSIGLQAEGRMAIEMGFFSLEELAREEVLLKRFGQPTTIHSEISIDELKKATILDKKARQGKARYALAKHIGEMCDFKGGYATEVPDEFVLKALRETYQ